VSKEFNPLAETLYRAATSSHAKTAGITLNRRICHKCKNPCNSTDGKIVRETSRHNPSKFYCVNCKDKI
jgi:hypothetical protein